MLGRLLQGFIAITVGTQLIGKVARQNGIQGESRMDRLKRTDPEQYLVEAMKPMSTC